ncbi:MAG: hypothetical protein QME96_14910, partial [Myxococcota bacterium]|nr:hypothetical protein [Myxococcota bacterium]
RASGRLRRPLGRPYRTKMVRLPPPLFEKLLPEPATDQRDIRRNLDRRLRPRTVGRRVWGEG